MNAASNSSNFSRMAAINVNEHVEKKNGLSYLSWPWAVDQLLRADPTATWEYRDFNGAPYLTLADGTAMVFCTVSASSLPCVCTVALKSADRSSASTPVNVMSAPALIVTTPLPCVTASGLYSADCVPLPTTAKPSLPVPPLKLIGRRKVPLV